MFRWKAPFTQVLIFIHFQALSNPGKDSLNVIVYATSIPGGSVSLCHAGTALCSLDDLVRVLIDEEVQTRTSPRTKSSTSIHVLLRTAAATLFRANTPLTKLLETAMRVYAYEYVRTAVGPTVRDICDRGLVLEEVQGRDVGTNHSEVLSPFVQSLWEDIYSKSYGRSSQLLLTPSISVSPELSFVSHILWRFDMVSSLVILGS